MKKIVTLIILLIPLYWGCSDIPVNPNISDQTINNKKSWITLPQNRGLGVEEEYSASKVINGEKGGVLDLNINYQYTSSKNLIITASIEVPAGAFSGNKNINMIIDPANGVATFYPSPETFNKSLLFNLKIQGIDLNGIDPDSLSFMYIDNNGSFAPVEYKNTVINSSVLIVHDALIPHFSMYGWCR